MSGDYVTFPASGRCASCGTRVVNSMDVGVYVPSCTCCPHILYLLCPSCASAIGTDTQDTVLLAVEQRIYHGRGRRA